MTLLLSVLGASLLGSVHCAAMCGGFVCLYSGTGPARHTGAAPHAAYNAGRLVSYLVLGAVAGSATHGVDRIGGAGVGRPTAIIAGALMVVCRGRTLLAALGVRMGPQPASLPLDATLTSLL